MSHAANLPTAWLLARSAGLAAFAALTASTWLGLAMSNRLFKPRFQKPLLGWHRTLVWTSLALVTLHVGALLIDPFSRIGPAAAVIPFASGWRPSAVAAGVVAAWLSLVLAVSFPLRRHIGQRTWRRLHYASFGAFLLALGHALTTGTDLAGRPWGVVLALVAGGPVLWLTLMRIMTPRTRVGRRAEVPG